MPPVYEYLCERCSGVSERERKVADRRRVAVCDHCGSRKTALTVSRCDFVLRGGSWAGTGYGTRSGRKKKQ